MPPTTVEGQEEEIEIAEHVTRAWLDFARQQVGSGWTPEHEAQLPRQIRRTAYHAAGHAIAAFAGYDTESATTWTLTILPPVKCFGFHGRRTEMRTPLLEQRQITEEVKLYGTWLYAGGVGQLFGDGIDPEKMPDGDPEDVDWDWDGDWDEEISDSDYESLCRVWQSTDDDRKALCAFAQERGRRRPVFHRPSWNRATRLLRDCHVALDTLAGGLMVRGTESSEVVKGVLGALMPPRHCHIPGPVFSSEAPRPRRRAAAGFLPRPRVTSNRNRR